MFRDESNGDTLRGGGAADGEGEAQGRAEGQLQGEIQIEPGSPRPATILRIAGELEERGEEIGELFKDVGSPNGNFVFPIHILGEDGEDVMVEVVTDEWNENTKRQTVRAAAILRESDYRDSELRVFSAYPVPEDVDFFLSRTPASLFQLGLLKGYDSMNPRGSAEAFRETAERCWGVDLDYTPQSLPLVEELLLSALRDESELQTTEVLSTCLGCYLGETIRRNSDPEGEWSEDPEWGGEYVVELGPFAADPLGEAREFLSTGSAEDSMAFYARFVLEELERGESGRGPDASR